MVGNSIPLLIAAVSRDVQDPQACRRLFSAPSQVRRNAVGDSVCCYCMYCGLPVVDDTSGDVSSHSLFPMDTLHEPVSLIYMKMCRQPVSL